MTEEDRNFQKFKDEVLVKIGFWELHSEDRNTVMGKMEEVAKEAIKDLQQK